MSSKRRKYQQSQQKAIDAVAQKPAGMLKVLPEAMQGVMTQDAFMNQMARTGYGSVNLMEGTQYPLTRLTRDYNLLNAMYRNNWLARRVVDIIPKDMLKNWLQYTGEISPDEHDMLARMERLTQLRAQLLRGLNWGRLYGGAAALMLLDRQGDRLDQPLDLDSIMPGDYKGLMIVDRWAGVYPQLELVDDINDPEFGLPKYYEFRDNASNATYTVHHSRLIRFTGADLPDWEKWAETYWGMSIIENVYEEIKKRDNVSANIASLTFLANLRILKMSDLGEMLGGTNVNAKKDLYKTLQAQNWLQSNMSIYVMSQEDDFQSVKTSYAGLDEIYECFMMDLSGASQIPVTKLFGRSPAGMNATGESDMRNYYDVVENEQETHLRPAMEKLGPVVCMSTLGYIPSDWGFDFMPIHSITEEEKSDKIKSVSEAVLGAHDRGVVSDRLVLEELQHQSKETGVFTKITDQMIEDAEEKPNKMEDDLALMQTKQKLDDPPALERLH